MNDVIIPQAAEADQADRTIRASDAERDEVVALLQRHFADGRLAQAEFDERAGAALTARTRDQLRALTADLPGTDVRPAWPDAVPEPWLLCLLLCVCPPAGIAYWLLTRRRAPGEIPGQVAGEPVRGIVGE